MLALTFAGCMSNNEETEPEQENGTETETSETEPSDNRAAEEWSQKEDIERQGEVPYESEDEDENLPTGRNLVIEGGGSPTDMRVEVYYEEEFIHSIEGEIPPEETVIEQNIARKRGVYEVRYYIEDELSVTLDWTVNEGYSAAFGRIDSGEVAAEVGKRSGAVAVVQVEEEVDEAPKLDETDLLEHGKVREAFEKQEDCLQNPSGEGCNYFADETTVGVQVTGVEGEELASLYDELSSIDEREGGAYVEKDDDVYEVAIVTEL